MIRRTLLVPFFHCSLFTESYQKLRKFKIFSLPPDERVPDSTERTCAGFRPCESQIEEVSESKNSNPNFLVSTFVYKFDFSFAYVLLQISKKSLSAAFTSASDEDLSVEDLNESVDFSPISEVSEANMNGEVTEVRLDSKSNLDESRCFVLVR